MFRSMWIWILNNVFRVQTETKTKELEDNLKYAYEYERIDDINFNAIFSNKLANYVVSDSSVNVDGDNERVEFLNKIAQSMWKKAKKITSMSFGLGGLFIVPYVKNGKIYYSLVPQSRVTIDSVDGELITGATILAERKEITNALGSTKIYIRWTNYRLENENIVIEQKFSNEEGKEIEVPDFWSNILLKQTITNVDRCLFGYIKSPINNRRVNDNYGVPITYGCEATIKEIKDTMKQIVREFKLKEAFVGADITMFSGKDGLPTNGLYRKIDSGDEKFWEVFDPAFRETSYHSRLEELYIRLEHEIGTSAGIMSKLETSNATATEIRRAMYDTFTIVDDMRSNIEKGFEDFFYACNVLANTYNLSKMGDYEIVYDWDYSLLEDTQEQFGQLIQGIGQGVLGKEELRNWLKPNETLEESKKAVEEIQKTMPDVEDMIGNDEEYKKSKMLDKKDVKKEDKKEDKKIPSKK